MRGKNIPSFVGDELSFLKLDSLLIGLIGGVSIFLESQYSQIVVSQAPPFTGHRVQVPISQTNTIFCFRWACLYCTHHNMQYNFKHITISNGWYIFSSTNDYKNYKLINRTISAHSSQLCWAFIEQFFVSEWLSRCVSLCGV